MSLWFMGYPEQAERQRQAGWEMIEALEMLGRAPRTGSATS